MKLVLFLILALSLSATAGVYSQNQRVSFEFEDATILEVLNEIKTQTGLSFIYNEDKIQELDRVSVDAVGKTVEEFLNEIFDKSNLECRFEGNVIMLVERKPQPVIEVEQEKKEIKGRVTDNQGVPLPGVSVVIKGTSVGVATDIDGNYAIEFENDDAVLVFSFVGMMPQEIAYTGQTELNVTLVYDAEDLDEVVVIGYGTQKRKDITGSVVSVNKDDLQVVSLGEVSFDKSLGGLMKGVQVTQNGGAPGAGASINIRGFTSPLSGGSNQPLYVIDGLPFNTDAQYSTGDQTRGAVAANPLMALNSNNIETIDVLKDAAATAIYGSRGANGVILITTRKGAKMQESTVDVSFTTTIGRPINKLTPMNTSQYKTYTDLIFKNSVEASNLGQLSSPYQLISFTDGEVGKLTLDFTTMQYSYDGLNSDFFGKENVDWFDEIYRNDAITNQCNVNVRGGSENTTYSLGGSYMDQEGLMIRNNLKQYSFYTNVDTKLSKKVKTGVSLNLGHAIDKSGEGGGRPSEEIALARPDLGVRDVVGDFIRLPNYMFGPKSFSANPVAKMHRKAKTNSYTMLGSMFLEAELLKGFFVKADASTGIFLTRADSFSPSSIVSDIFPGSPSPASTLSNSKVLNSNIVSNLTGRYHWEFNKNKFDILAGYSWDRTKIKETSNSYSGFIDDNVLTNVSSASRNTHFGEGEIESGLNSFFGRIEYSYKDLYNATVNFRSDASSKFGPGNKRAYFPSLSVGWNINNHEFFRVKTIDRLKLRASVGRVGSANISDFAYLQFFKKGFMGKGKYNGDVAVVVSQDQPNENIGWETTSEINFGIEFSMFERRLFGSLDLYRRKTTGALATSPFPLELGTTNFTSNLMDISNKGIEFELGGYIFYEQEGFNWRSSINLSFNRNIIESLNGATISDYMQDLYIQGQPIGTIKGYQVEGIYQYKGEIDALNVKARHLYGVEAFYDQKGTAPGDYHMKDVNGDGKITIEDRSIIGSIEPDFFGGFSSTFSYKNFELNAFFQFSVGAKAVWRTQNPNGFGIIASNNWNIYADNTWTAENPTAKYPRAVNFDPGKNRRMNDKMIYDASYLRFKNVQLKYNIQSKTLNQVGVNGAAVFIAATNLFTLTQWPGLDPETVAAGSPASRTENSDPYPLSKTISLGFNIHF